MQTRHTAKGLLNKLFPYYDEFAYVFERDRTTGHFTKTFVDVGSNDPSGYEGFQMPDGNDMEFLSMYNQGFDMSQDDVRALLPAHTLEGRARSSESKRQRRRAAGG
uniref:Retrotransposon protein n=1 Tax=Cucumis melo TaxID=3656 RepID=A0A9I9CYL2_CUCME